MRTFTLLLLTSLVMLPLPVDAQSPDGENPFLLEGEVVPPRAALGERVGFRLTVTNTGNEPASFGVDGCPVHYVLDREYRPMWGCAELWAEITLRPGQSHIFSFEEDPRLIHDPWDYPLAPGVHEAILQITSVGRIAVRFGVREPDPNLTYLSGRITREKGIPIPGAVVTLTGEPRDSTHLDPEGPPPDREHYQARTGQEGWYFFGGIAPSTYILSAMSGSQVLWYPGVTDPAGALPIPAAPGTYVQGLDLTFDTAPPPPPPPTGFAFRGRVFEISDVGFAIPVPGAYVAAIPLEPAYEDTVRPQGPAGGADGPGDPGYFRPPYPFVTHAGEDGSYVLAVPPGLYRLIAGRPGTHAYRYWPDAADWHGAEPVMPMWDEVPPGDDARPFILSLPPQDSGEDAVIRGQVWDDNPMLGRPPMPLPGALVTAWPLGPMAERRVLVAETDEGGFYEIPVPNAFPYRVRAQAPDFRPEFFDNALTWWEATGVDVRPGEVTEAIGFGLQPFREPPPGPGTFYGHVTELTASGDAVPVPDAWVLAVLAGSAFPDTLPPPGLGGADPGTGDIGPGQPLFYVRTERDGSFALEAPPGLYRLLAGKESGYLYRYWRNVSRWNEAELVFPRPPDSRMPDIDYRFQLPATVSGESAILSGTVLGLDPLTDGLPEPVPGARVMARPIAPFGPEVLLITRTDENGVYELRVPPFTPYRVLAEAEGFHPQFFQFKTYAWEADGVDVAPGSETRDVDFRLLPRNPGEVTGAIEGVVLRRDPNVRCDDGARCLVPAPGVLVRVEAAYPTFAPYVLTTRTDREGRFRIAGIAAAPDGSLPYYVSAIVDGMEPLFYPGGVPFERAEPLPVYPGQISDAGAIVIPYDDPPHHGWTGGVVLDPDEQPVAGAIVRLYLRPEDPGGPVLTTTTESNGGFAFNLIPVDVRAIAAVEKEGYVPVYFPGVHRWREAGPVPIGGPAVDIVPMRIVLSPGVGGGPFIQAGRVRVAEDAKTTPDSDFDAASPTPRFRALRYHAGNVSRAHFYLVSALSASPAPIPLAGGVTGDNGTVVLTGLPEGAYLAFADRPGFAPAWYSLDHSGTPETIILNGSTPGVLAEIFLVPSGAAPEDGNDPPPPMVDNLRNAPNPFHQSTTIHFDLNEDEPVTVQVFDFRGRLVKTLMQGSLLAGPHTVEWDGTNRSGRAVSNGVYFYRIRAGAEIASRKMVLMLE